MLRWIRSASLVLAVALAVWIGLASIGGFVHALGLVVLWIVLAAVAALVVLAGRILNRPVRPVVMTIGYAAALLLISLPVATGADFWRGAEARRWCERVAPRWASEPWARRDSLARADSARPRFAAYVQGGCESANPERGDPQTLRYDPAADAWTEIDRSDRASVAEARIWCERVTPDVAGLDAPAIHRRAVADSTRPGLVDLDSNRCRINDPNAFLDGAAWHYDAETLTWDEVPE